jgi:uncharacterized protein (TIRG00374 family)
LLQNAQIVARLAEGAGPALPRQFPGPPNKDLLVTKRTTINILKYVLAAVLLTAVVYSYWGHSSRVASKIVAGPGPYEGGKQGPPTVAGNVVAYLPGQSLAIEEPGETKDSPSRGYDFTILDAKTQLEETHETIRVGSEVAVWEYPLGLAYVWQKHVVEGQPVHLGFLLLAFVFGFVSIVITFVRWYYLVRAQDLPFRMPDALRLGFIGFFFNTFMPGSVGGDVIKAAFLAREQRNRRTVAVATVIMDRAIALWALVWFVAISGLIFWVSGLLEGPGAARSLLIVKVAGIIVGISFLAWLSLGLLPSKRAEKFATRLSRIRKIGHSLAELWRAVWMYRCRQGQVAVCMLISWVGHVGFVLFFFCSAHFLYDASDPTQKIPSLAQHFLIVPIGLVINALPGSPGGAGVGELAYGGLYTWLGASAACGVLGSLVYRVVQWVLSIIGYFIYRHLRTDLQIPTGDGNRPAPAEETESVAVGS